MKLTITKVSNGYLVDGKNPNTGIPEKFVLEEKDTEFSELEVMENLLYYIKEYFGIIHSKHNKKNLVIDIEVNK